MRKRTPLPLVESPLTQARQKLGLSLGQAAKLARIGPTYLRRVEKHRRAPYGLAVRLSRIYGISADHFI